MRLDYTLYVLAAIILIITIIPFVVTIEGVAAETRTLWVVATVVLGLLSIGLGYSQRPKTEAQACELAVSTPEEPTPQTPPAPAMETPKEKEAEAPMEKPAIIKTSASPDSVAVTMGLTQVKGIGEKRAKQLNALGINSVDDLAKSSANPLAKKLKISPKTTEKWVANAKELIK